MLQSVLVHFTVFSLPMLLLAFGHVSLLCNESPGFHSAPTINYSNTGSYLNETFKIKYPLKVPDTQRFKLSRSVIIVGLFQIVILSSIVTSNLKMNTEVEKNPKSKIFLRETEGGVQRLKV